MDRRTAVRVTIALALLGPLLAGVAGPGAAPAIAAVTPVTNPEITEKCGVDLTLVLDASGSVQQSNAVNQVRDAAEAFLDALSNTGSTARVTQFATVAEQLAPSTVVDDESLGPNGILRGAIGGYYNPRPPRPAGVNFIDTRNQVNNSTNNNQYTNWDGSLNQAGDTVPNLVVYVTDGDPTAYDLDKAGDPGDAGPPPDIRYGTSSTDTQTVDRAVEEANRIKTNGSRMLAVGVGNALGNSSSQQRLRQISGPQVVRDAGLAVIDSLNDVDVALVTDFDDLAAFLRSVVLQLCSPSLTIQKLAQTPGSAAYGPARGWDMTVSPRVPTGSGFTWILPAAGVGPTETVTTDVNGFAQFQWEPIPPEADSAAGVSEVLRPGYIAGRPGPDNDWSCDFKNEAGEVRSLTGELDLGDPDNPSFDLDPIGQEIGTCKVYNSFDYQPAIELSKVNTPTSLRGDLDPPATVTSDFEVTNPGNTPLANVSVTDDVCGAADPVPTSGDNAGDTDGDGLLDVGETWQFTCTHDVSTPDSTNPAGQNIVNTATASGSPPAGDQVTDTATDDVDAFNPAITLTKLVNGEEAVTIGSGTDATYTYQVANTGNTPLGSVVLGDDTPPCESPTRGADAPGNGDNTLGVGETWTYTCTSQPTQDVHNVADVTATPLNPTQGNVPFTGSNPPVTAIDDADVVVVNPAIQLSKVAEPSAVLFGEDQTEQAVTYRFTATNPGEEPLNRPGAEGGDPGTGTKDPGWVEDIAPDRPGLGRCDANSPPTYDTGDANDNDLLDPGEEWEFSCPGTVRGTTVNIARIIGQPSNEDGSPIPDVDTVQDQADAIVRTARPGISVVKTALRDPVLDPDAVPVSGPDVPDPRPAEYTYEVTNTGTVPLALNPSPPVDDQCGPLLPAPSGRGDTNSDDLLQPGEVWHYVCQTTLDPDGNEPGLVENTVTVRGVPFFDGALAPDKVVTDTDTAQVLVIEPGISITKTASATGVRVGRDVTYTFAVTNTGDVGLSDVVPVDDKCAPLVRTGGDDGNEILDGADSGGPETWTYTCTRPVSLPEPPDTTDLNTVSVTGVDPLGNTYDADASAEVTVIDPGIHLEKSVSDDLVLSGSTVEYTFLATNRGQSPFAEDDVLEATTLLDATLPSNPGCRVPELVAKEGGNQDDLLEREPAETWRYTCQGTITRRTVDLAAVGALGGTTIQDPIPVTDFATAQVTPFHPGIEVDKTATPTSVTAPGGEVTYTYRVRNTGDVPLGDVTDRVTDDTCSPVTYVSGDIDGDGLLDSPVSIFEDALDETWVFTCSAFVDQDTVNTVVAEGTPVDPSGDPLCGPDTDPPTAPCDVDARDQARVTIAAVEPGGGVLPSAVQGATSSPSVAGVLPDSGAPPWLGTLVALGAGLLLAGAAMVAVSERHRRRALHV